MLRYRQSVSESQPAGSRQLVPTIPGLSGLSVLARGGYATIYRAIQDSIGREVAVKVENRTLESERDQRRFLREARAAGQMSAHPYVVDLHDVGVTADQHPFMIMDLCDGSYDERLRADPLTPGETRDVGAKIADALAIAHLNGVLHRDVKPANLLISRYGEPLLADFGLAVLAETRETSITLEVLTPAYSPPETFRHGPPTAAVDVYGLSATLYAMLCGRPPRFQHDPNPSLVALLELFDQPIPDLPGVPAALLDLLRMGMANDPLARPTAGRLRDLLAELPLEREPNPSAVRGSARVPVPRSASDATQRA
jgi:serine/threonine protein kinase